MIADPFGPSGRTPGQDGSFVDTMDHRPNPNYKVVAMSAFGWLAAGQRRLLAPWLRRRETRPKSASRRRANLGMESLESIDLMSHASLGLLAAHLEAVTQAKAKTAALVSKVTTPAKATGHVVSLATATKTVTPVKTPVVVVKTPKVTPKTPVTTSTPTSTSTPIKIAATTQTTSLQTATVPSTLTNFNQPFAPAINLFDPKLGTLVDVKVTESATLTSNIVSENTSTSSDADITGELNGNVTINGLSTGAGQTYNLSGFTQTLTAPAYTGSGTPDFTGPSTITFPPIVSTSGVKSYDYTDAADLALFTASSAGSTVTPTLIANAQAVATAPNGNLQTKVNTSGLGTVTVTYDYVPTPANVVKVTRFGIHHQPTVIQVAFSGTVDPTAAATPSNYTIILPNANGKFTGPGTLTLPIASATFDATTKTATLVSSKRFNFRGQAEIVITLPGTTPLTVQFGGADSLGGYLNKQGQFVQYIPGVTKLPV